MSASRHLETLTRASVTDVVALATAKARLGITASTEDTQLAGWIDDATGDLGKILERGTLAFQRYKETQWLLKRSRKLILQRAPVEKGSLTVVVGTTTITDYELQDHEAGLLWREDGWPAGEDIIVTYRAGWLVEGQITAWAATTAFPTAAGIAWVRPTDPADTPFLLEATTAGTTDSTEPTWPTTIGGTVADGTVTWTARAVEELPNGLLGLAIAAVQELREGVPRSVTRERTGADDLTFDTGGDLYSARLLRAMERYRL